MSNYRTSQHTWHIIRTNSKTFCGFRPAIATIQRAQQFTMVFFAFSEYELCTLLLPQHWCLINNFSASYKEIQFYINRSFPEVHSETSNAKVYAYTQSNPCGPITFDSLQGGRKAMR